jgi:choline monooxygenase
MNGRGRAPSLVCRYHGWAYGLDGRLRSARDVGATDGFDPADVSLTRAAVEEWRGLVFVNLDLDHTAPPLLEALGTFADECEPYLLTHEAQHELACNWQAYADNYLEGYHIPLSAPGPQQRATPSATSSTLTSGTAGCSFRLRPATAP